MLVTLPFYDMLVVVGGDLHRHLGTLGPKERRLVAELGMMS